MAEPDAPLPVLREHLTEIDRQIVALIAERFRLVGDVGRSKQGTDHKIRDAEREQAVLAAVEDVARATGAPVNLVRRMYRDLLGESVHRQVAERNGSGGGPVRLAAHGGDDSPDVLAAHKWLAASGREAEVVPAPTHAATVKLLRDGAADLAVLPIEDTLAGSYTPAYEVLRESRVAIVGEETWSAADDPDNLTRFVLLARDPVPVDLAAPCKTSLVFVTRHEHGALIRSLEVLASTGHSMTKLESRPRPGRPWEYMFFLDFEGNITDPRTAAALDELRGTTLHLTVLGSYPAKVARTDLHDGSRVLPGELSGDALEPPGGPPPRRPSASYRLAGRDARPEDTVIPVGDLLVGGAGFVVMAGPCSVESADQVMTTARAVRTAGAVVLRGGVFKPRTSPYAFQGLGWDGLDLLVAAGRATGMPVISEVMAVEQVQRMAKSVDILQVGARNMQNFDLLREIGRVDRPVLLKRGLSSTIDEWLGAAEYILSVGNQQVMLCERGIRTFETSTRNTLDLSAIPVLRERTHLPVIVDPSHGTGYRAYVAPMARAARAAGAHGLLIEVHPDPDSALSDAAQSLSLPEFAALMRGLNVATAAP